MINRTGQIRMYANIPVTFTGTLNSIRKVVQKVLIFNIISKYKQIRVL
jgi:hypothetical protein